MPFDWQTPVALFVVAAACVWLARQAWHVLASPKSRGCGSCGSKGCAAPDGGPVTKPLVSLGPPRAAK